MTRHRAKGIGLIVGAVISLLALVHGLTDAGLPSVVRALLASAGAVGFAMAGIPVARRLFPLEVSRQHVDLLGATLGLVGTVYAVVVGFAVIVVWEAIGETNVVVAKEANALAGLERLSGGFPIEVRRQVQEASRTYAQVVAAHEWETMRTGAASPMAHAALIELWSVYTDMGDRQQRLSVYSESLARLAELDDNRRERLLAAESNVPPVMWMLMCIGGLVTLVLAYAFGIGRDWRLHVIVGILSATIAFAMALVAIMDGPFRGDMRADASPFLLVLSTISAPE